MGVKNELPPKREVAIALLEASSVYVHLDPRASGVMVPAWFKKQPQLVLQVGLNMPVPIPDLDVGEEALSCTLSFNRRPEYCRIPWSAVYGLVGEDGRGMIWPEDVPPEVAAQAQGRSPAPKEQRHLRAVAEGGEAPAEAKEATSPVEEPRPAQGQPAPGPSGQARPAQPGEAPAKKAGGAGKKAAAATATGESAPSKKRSGAKSEGPKRAPEPAAPAPSDGRSKRELPPYLRVVK
jgi:stringent starvation protein B